MYKFDVALSFAGEDRKVADALANALRQAGVTVFYDRYKQAELWGKDLYQHLQKVYRDEAQYCVILISQYYASKLWPRHELKQAQARAFRESREYILPVRLDDTNLPGLNTTVGYVDIRELSVASICELILQKLGKAAVPSPTDLVAATPSDDDEPELLDLRVEMDDAFRSSMDALAKISELSTRGAASDREWQAEARRFLASGSRSPHKSQMLVNLKATDFAERSRSLEMLVSNYRKETTRFFDGLERLIDFQIRNDLSTLDEIRSGLRSFARADEGASGVRQVYMQMVNTARGLSTPTRYFKRQRNAFVAAVESFNAAVEYWLTRSAAVRARFGADDKLGGQ